MNVEEAAKALHKDYDDGKLSIHFPWEAIPEVSRENFRRIARLVLAAGSDSGEDARQIALTALEQKIARIMHDHQGLDDYHQCKCGVDDEYWWEHVAGVLMAELGLHEMPEAPGYYMTEWVRKPSSATRSGGRLFSMPDPERRTLGEQ